MPRTLWAKFLLLLLGVAAVALSAALLLRLLVIRDFRAYLEGQREDSVYWITADAERTYVTHGGWGAEWLREDAVWAWMLGFHIRVLDAHGRLVADAETSAPPSQRASAAWARAATLPTRAIRSSCRTRSSLTASASARWRSDASERGGRTSS